MTDLLSTATFDDRPPNPPEWLIEGILPLPTCGVIGGEPEAYKTWFALDCAVALASGTKVLRRFKPATTGRTLIYSPEGHGEALRRRLYGLCLGRGLDYRNVLRHIHIIREPVKVDNADAYMRLGRTIIALDPALLIMDPLVKIHNADENSANEMQTVLDAIRGLQGAKEALVILLVHHKNKGGSGGGYALRGSSAIYGWEDTLITIEKDDEAGPTAPRTLRMSHRDNVAPSACSFSLRIYDINGQSAYALEPGR